jgi:hypothetical protein
MSKLLLEIPFNLRTPRSSTKVLAIYDEGMVFDGDEYSIEELEGISSSVIRHYVNGIYTGTTFEFVIYFDSGDIRISFRQLKNKDKDNTGSYNLLVKVGREFLGPIIVNRIVKTIFDEGEYQVGKLTFTPDSIRKKGMFGGKELSYEDIIKYEVGNGAMILKTSNNQAIRTSLEVENAYLLPDICTALYNANNKTF